MSCEKTSEQLRQAADEIERLWDWVRRVSVHDFLRHDEDFASTALAKLTNEAKNLLKEQ